MSMKPIAKKGKEKVQYPWFHCHESEPVSLGSGQEVDKIMISIITQKRVPSKVLNRTHAL